VKPSISTLSIFRLGTLLWYLAGTMAHAETPLKAAPDHFHPFQLPDQFRHEHVVVFTNAPLQLLTVADQKGAVGMDPWIDAVKTRFGTNLPMIAVADVSKVPRLLRGFIRGKFVDRYPYPVLLDFTGDTIAAWRPQTGEPNLYLVAQDGNVLGRFVGQATSSNTGSLLSLIEKKRLDSATKTNPAPTLVGSSKP
jgi:hypothetical protein